jgi:hypothetical protein
MAEIRSGMMASTDKAHTKPVPRTTLDVLRNRLAWYIHDCDYDACSDWAKQRIDERIFGGSRN